MQNTSVEFVCVGKRVKFRILYKGSGGNVGEGQAEFEKKNRKPNVRGAAVATGGIFGATDYPRENSEDPEPSDKVSGIFEVEWEFRRKEAGHAGVTEDCFLYLS